MSEQSVSPVSQPAGSSVEQKITKKAEKKKTAKGNSTRPPRSQKVEEEVVFQAGKFPVVYKVTAEPPPEPTTVEADLTRPIFAAAESVSTQLQAITQGAAYDYFSLGRCAAVACAAVAAKLSAVAKEAHRVSPSYEPDAHTLTGLSLPPLFSQLADMFSEVKYGSMWVIPQRADSYATALLGLAAILPTTATADVEKTIRDTLLEVAATRGVIVGRTTRLKDAVTYYYPNTKVDEKGEIKEASYLFFKEHWSYIRKRLTGTTFKLAGVDMYLPEDVMHNFEPTASNGWNDWWANHGPFWKNFGFTNVSDFATRLFAFVHTPNLLKIRKFVGFEHFEGEACLGQAYLQLREWSPNLRRIMKGTSELGRMTLTGRRSWLISTAAEDSSIRVTMPFPATAEEVSLAAFLCCKPPVVPEVQPYSLHLPTTVLRLRANVEHEIYSKLT